MATNKKNKARKFVKKLANTRRRKEPAGKKKKKLSSKTAKKSAKFLIGKKTKKMTTKKSKAAPKKKKIKTSLIFYSLAIKPKEGMIRAKSAKISPYLLDLKQIEANKKITAKKEQTTVQTISREIFGSLNKKQNTMNKSFHTFQNKLKTSWQKKPALNISLPKISLPKISLPQINLPRLKFPQIPRFKIPEIKIGGLIIPPYWQKAVLGFFIFSLVFVMPFALYDHYQKLEGKKNLVLEKTAQALWHLTISQKAASATDFYYTQFELQQAAYEFNAAKKEIENINLLTKKAIALIPHYKKQFTTAQNLLSAGGKLSSSAAILAATFDQINNEFNLENLNLTDRLIILKDNLNLIMPDIESANNELQKIYLEEIPDEYQDKIKQLQIALPLFKNTISEFISSSEILLSLLGYENTQRYLLIFQNNNEIRPTGGFIGSFALVDIDKGNIEKINIPGGGPYDLKAGLKVSLESPLPLRLINPRWEFQDANWFPDLPTSANKLIWLYEKSGGPTVDGLILINATFLEKVLEITGPIELPEYGKIIDSENFFSEIQASVELEYDKEENKPKQIIADLTPKIINILLNSDKKQFTEILDLLFTSLNEKEIQLYFTNFILEKMLLRNNWGGQIKKTDRDYLNIVSTNIAGEKTDAKIKQNAYLETDIQPDGSIINTLTITKTHTGQEGEVFYGVPNLDYLRIYVPKDSQLISAENFTNLPPELFTLLDPSIYQKDPDIAMIEMTKKIDEESQTEIYYEGDKTVFANWMKTNPGETKTITIKYKLPFQLNFGGQDDNPSYFDLIKKTFNFANNDSPGEKYSLLWQKQAGKRNFHINLKIKFPQSFNYQAVYPENLKKNNNVFSFHDELNTDKIFAIIFSQF